MPLNRLFRALGAGSASTDTNLVAFPALPVGPNAVVAVVALQPTSAPTSGFPVQCQRGLAVRALSQLAAGNALNKGG